MLRMREDVFRPPLLDHPARVHHDDPIANSCDDAEIVGDQDGRHPGIAVQFAQELEDLRLDGDVESRGGLVGDEQARVGGQAHRDHGPLTHAAGENVRILGDAFLRVRDADLSEQLGRCGDRGSNVHTPMDPQRFSDLPAGAVYGVEGGHRVLEDHRDLGSSDVFHLILGEPGHVTALEPNRTAGDPARTGQQPHDRQSGHRLARARLTDDAQGLAGVDVEGDSVDGPHHAVFQGQIGVHIFELEQMTERHYECSLGSSASRSESPRRLKL